jgi:glycosyltransferase involved in cell wall biosynthesis
MEKSKKIISLQDGFIQKENFIIFGEDFERHPHALEHVLRPLFENNRFIWVETIGLRSPRFNLYDLKRISEKILKWFSQRVSAKKNHVTKTKNVFVISPFMIPFNQYFLIRKFNQWNVTRSIQKILLLHKMDHPISIASVPNAADYIGHFNEHLKIYYCVDEFSLWPGLNKKLVEHLEKSLIRNVDLIVATSEFLTQSKTISGQLTPLITHGVDFHHFNIGSQKSPSLRLQLCYFGLFDERSDQNIIEEIARAIPNCEIHIFGKIACNVKQLNTLKNIFFHGNIHYQDLPKAILKMDIFLLPYKRNKLTDNINPLKLKEYLSTGRPVIATELPEVVKLKDYLFLAKDSQEFIKTINNLVLTPSLFQNDKVLTYISRHETWPAKTKQLSEIIFRHSLQDK